METKFKYIAVALLLSALSFTSGCSLIGYGIGSAIDNRKPKVVEVSGDKLDSIKPGKKLYCILNDGEVIRGKAAGYDRMTPEEYSAEYETCRFVNTGNLHLPAMHGPIIITATSGEAYEYQFEGFDVYCTEFGHLPTMLLVWGEVTEPLEVRLANMKSAADSDGNEFDLKAISKYILDGQIPVFSQLHICTNTGMKEIDCNELKYLPTRLINRKYGRFAALKDAGDDMIYFTDDGAYCRTRRDKTKVVIGKTWNGGKVSFPLTTTTALYKDVSAPLDTAYVGLNQYEYLGWRESKNTRWTFLVMGLAVDALIVAFAISMADWNVGLGGGGGGYYY